MRKLIVGVGLAVAVFTADAQQWVERDFLQGNRAVQITNAATVLFGASLVPYTNGSGNVVYSGTNLFSTNSIVSPGTLHTNTSVTYGNAWGDVVAFSDRDGNGGAAALVISGTGSTYQSTNTLTLTFGRVLSKDYTYDVVETNARTLAVAFTPNGTNHSSMSTNLSTAQMTGCYGFRLLSVVSGNHGAAGSVYLQKVTLNGYAP